VCWNGGYTPGNLFHEQSGVIDPMRCAIEACQAQQPRLLEHSLQNLLPSLRERDHAARFENPPRHSTAFSSDGNLAERVGNIELASEFVRLATQHLVNDRSGPDINKVLIRCLGYMSVADKSFLAFVRERVPHLPSAWISPYRQPLLVACGNCLRDPEDCSDFAFSCARWFTANPSSPSNDWMKALCQILRYRDDACERCDTDLCEFLAWECHKRAHRQIQDTGNARFIYRYGTLAIAFLLRRRRFDDSYLDPSSERGREIKRFMMSVADGIRDGQIGTLQGVVNPELTTRKIIDYIDRQGHGIIGVADE